MDPKRTTGELEGTTLGSNSRDGDQGNRSQRRTHSSSGFLVDSSLLPRSKSLRSSYHRSRRSELDDGGKRGTQEVDIGQKKRSRFPWGRHKEPSKEAQANHLDTPADQVTPGPSHPRQDLVVHERQSRATESQGPVGMDKDSLQIVNLALNLSESRKRKTLGYPTSNQLSGGRWTSPVDGRVTVSVSRASNRSDEPRHNLSQTFSDDRVKRSGSSGLDLIANEYSTVLNYLPHSAASDNLPHGFSGSTLTRAAKARRHFELFHEYLRLLPSLPPLKPFENSNTESSWTPNNPRPSHRVYNPLQSIRNRKVRFRERCPIDPETAGWNNVEKVHNWIDSVETRYGRQAHSHLECLALPPIQQGQNEVLLQEDHNDADAMAISPPSSLRRVSRASSLKARRPRSDWAMLPDELLADAAWTEESQNKTKMVDRDGNNLFPDPKSLVVNDPHQQQAQPNQEPTTGVEQLSSHTSFSGALPRFSGDPNHVDRGRQPQQIQNPNRAGRSSSASAKGYSSRRHKLGMRSSSSRSSSADGRLSGNFLVRKSTASRRSISPHRRKGPTWSRYDEKRASMSSIPSADDRYDPLSLARMESRVANTAMDIGYFPSIASNLSAPSSRSPSPSKRGFTRAIGSRRDQSRRSSPQRKEAADDSSPGSEAVRRSSPAGAVNITLLPADLEPGPPPSKASTLTSEDPTRPPLPERKESAPYESKLRGIFKGPSKIAGKVGNEVSKMGDFILKKESLAHSPFANSGTSDGSSSDDGEIKSDKISVPKAILRRFPTFSDDSNRPSPRNSEKSLAKNNTPSLSPLPSSLKDDEDDGRRLHSAETHESLSRVDDNIEVHKKDSRRRSGGFITHEESPFEFGPELHTIREEIKMGRIRDHSVPFSLTRPPVTGLAKAQAITAPASQDKHPKLASQSRSWSISDRSLSVLIDSGVPGKSEIERTRALLLSSGIKAREITRRAEIVRSPPPEFLRRSSDPDIPLPSVPRLYEHDLASQNILKRVEASHNLFQQSLDRIPKEHFSPLKAQLMMLEEFVTGSLNPRVHAATREAENLSIQLNTTSTLAVKQLSETLDKGIRRRHRRLRWLRRTGFVMLEWALVAILWWVWLIVVAFKLLRKVLRGLMSGLRWVLWL